MAIRQAAKVFTLCFFAVGFYSSMRMAAL